MKATNKAAAAAPRGRVSAAASPPQRDSYGVQEHVGANSSKMNSMLESAANQRFTRRSFESLQWKNNPPKTPPQSLWTENLITMGSQGENMDEFLNDLSDDEFDIQSLLRETPPKSSSKSSQPASSSNSSKSSKSSTRAIELFNRDAVVDLQAEVRMLKRAFEEIKAKNDILEQKYEELTREQHDDTDSDQPPPCPAPRPYAFTSSSMFRSEDGDLVNSEEVQNAPETENTASLSYPNTSIIATNTNVVAAPMITMPVYSPQLQTMPVLAAAHPSTVVTGHQWPNGTTVIQAVVQKDTSTECSESTEKAAKKSKTKASPIPSEREFDYDKRVWNNKSAWTFSDSPGSHRSYSNGEKGGTDVELELSDDDMDEVTADDDMNGNKPILV